MGKRYISDLFAAYTDADGVVQSGQRGDEVELTAADEKRLDAAGALAPKTSRPAPEPVPAPVLTEVSDGDLDAWVKDANAKTILAAADDPEKAAKLLESEQRQASPRAGLIRDLTAIVDKATA